MYRGWPQTIPDEPTIKFEQTAITNSQRQNDQIKSANNRRHDDNNNNVNRVTDFFQSNSNDKMQCENNERGTESGCDLEALAIATAAPKQYNEEECNRKNIDDKGEEGNENKREQY